MLIIFKRTSVLRSNTTKKIIAEESSFMELIKKIICKQSAFVLFLCIISSNIFIRAQGDETPATSQTNVAPEAESAEQPYTPRFIKAIKIVGNKYISAAAILSQVPFKIGEIFNPQKTGAMIRNIYATLQRIRDVKVYAKNIDEDALIIYIVIDEKKILKDVLFKGNSNLTEKDIKAKINFSEIPSIDQEELKKYALSIKKLYLDKGYHLVEITADLETDNDQATAIFTIQENEKAIVKRITFTGNKHISSKEIKQILYTREDWILGFMDRAGTYHPDQVEADRHQIEQMYQNQGYLTAKVTGVQTIMDPKSKNIKLDFEIQEGDLYTIKEVKAQGNELLTETYLLDRIPVRSGDNYSREAIVEAIKQLEKIWGNMGYIFAHIEPSIQPDEDTKTVNVAFYTDLGDKVFLNKINIKGNRKTKDKIIRRRLLLEEGEALTNFRMDTSKERVESLGFFDARDGVNWKVIRLDNDQADLDLLLKEAKTGKFHLKLGFGGAGNLTSPASGMTLGVELADTNLFGSGIQLNTEASWAKEQTSILFHLAQPWLFDRPISGAMDIYHKRPTYDDLNLVMPIHEKLTGGALSAGFIARTSFIDDTQVLFSFGADSVNYEKSGFSKEEVLEAEKNGVPLPLRVRPGLLTVSQEADYQLILNREFFPNTFVWFANSVEQDQRNHPMHTSRGHKWRAYTKFALPASGGKYRTGFFKFDIDALWFTPLINEYDLVFRLHGHFGIVTPFKHKLIPYGELYNIGGPASVRGFTFGQIGPKYLGDSIGANKAVFVNAELIFPITPDFSMKGVIFYDGGAGWDNPNAEAVSCRNITGNSFSYRHSVGLGMRILNPMPMRIDWGFKLDPRRDRLNPKNSESASEIHFGMTYDW